MKGFHVKREKENRKGVLGLECFVSHLDVTLTSSVGPECVELISSV